MNLRIATLNTYFWTSGPWGIWWRAKDWNRRLRAAAHWIRREKLDVVFVQEVIGVSASRGLQRESGLPYGFFPGQGSGLGILSRYRLSETDFLPFRWQGSYGGEALRLAARMKNGVASARLRLSSEREVRLFATHLLARYHEVPGFHEPSDSLTPERQANLLELGKRMRETLVTGEPWVLAGDFNMNQDSSEGDFFARFGGAVDALKTDLESRGESRQGLATYTAENPWVRAQGNPGEGILDYIFFSEGAFSVESARIALETDPFSDHRAVVAELRCRAARAAAFSLPRLSTEERNRLDGYFAGVRLPLMNYLAPLQGWTQRRDIRRFLHLL